MNEIGNKYQDLRDKEELFFEVVEEWGDMYDIAIFSINGNYKRTTAIYPQELTEGCNRLEQFPWEASVATQAEGKQAIKVGDKFRANDRLMPPFFKIIAIKDNSDSDTRNRCQNFEKNGDIRVNSGIYCSDVYIVNTCTKITKFPWEEPVSETSVNQEIVGAIVEGGCQCIINMHHGCKCGAFKAEMTK